MRLGRVLRGLSVAGGAIALGGGTASGHAAAQPVIVFSADRAPSLSGEIYRVDPNGRVVDLSDSPYQDVNPSVSPDGKHVAFLSDRSGAEGIYEVGIDGRGLVRVAPSLQVTCASFPGGSECPSLAWQPHGSRIALAANDHLWIVRPHRPSVELRWSLTGGEWSPDGRILLAWDAGVVAVTPRGHRLWTVSADDPAEVVWSSKGLLAVDAYRGAAVYDERGHRRFAIRIGAPASNPALYWSPGGQQLAVVSGKELEVRATTGRTVLRKPIGKGDVVTWEGNARLVLGGYGACGCNEKVVDVRTGKMLPASDRFAGPTSPDGSLAILTPPSRGRFALQVAPTAGGPAKIYTHVPGCSQSGGWGPDVGRITFVPGSRSLVYASVCTAPYPGLYSVPASGGTPRLVTQTPREPHSSPALSPDGNEIAYSTQCDAHLCGGPGAIDVASMDGAERAVTVAGKCGADEWPTWSPDGTTILFAHWGCDGQPELYTVPASGAPTVHDLGISGTQPAWGPSRIAYVGTAAPSAVWTANPDGTDPVRVGAGAFPAWSPSGQLAYLTGTNFTTLVVGSAQASLPFPRVTSLAWSPDGTRLVVTARAANTAAPDVYTINPDGTDPLRLTTNYDALSVTG